MSIECLFSARTALRYTYRPHFKHAHIIQFFITKRCWGRKKMMFSVEYSFQLVNKSLLLFVETESARARFIIICIYIYLMVFWVSYQIYWIAAYNLHALWMKRVRAHVGSLAKCMCHAYCSIARASSARVCVCVVVCVCLQVLSMAWCRKTHWGGDLKFSLTYIGHKI